VVVEVVGGDVGMVGVEPVVYFMFHLMVFLKAQELQLLLVLAELVLPNICKFRVEMVRVILYLVD
jgi:hypothetical protein